ncbi:threonylcarbamoyl-AMP synthase [Candidatus Micrarchaeota archaeon]|nr:MAG: threonylcarbamoyl-AMP synthase [Candidatus Micrarchaeota archaeon]
MKIVKADEKEAIELASDSLQAGGIVIYPTDTIYGLGVDARNFMAVKRLDELKNREGKPLSILVSDMGMAEQYCRFTPFAKKYIEHLLPGPYTVVLERQGDGIAWNAAGDTVGIRLPNYEFPVSLVRGLGFPITSTSANLSTKPAPCKVDEIDEKIREGVDVIVDGGMCEYKEGSTVIDLRGKEAVVLRRGAGYEQFLKLQKSIL